MTYPYYLLEPYSALLILLFRLLLRLVPRNGLLSEHQVPLLEFLGGFALQVLGLPLPDDLCVLSERAVDSLGYKDSPHFGGQVFQGVDTLLKEEVLQKHDGLLFVAPLNRDEK